LPHATTSEDGVGETESQPTKVLELSSIEETSEDEPGQCSNEQDSPSPMDIDVVEKKVELETFGMFF
jgi:hypothetical protein